MYGEMPACGCRTCCPASGEPSQRLFKGYRLPAGRAAVEVQPYHCSCQTWKLPAPYCYWDSHASWTGLPGILPMHSPNFACRDGETELVSDALRNEPAPAKLAYAGAAASVILLGASALCWLCGNDLLGGASLSPHSLKAAEVRALWLCSVLTARSQLGLHRVTRHAACAMHQKPRQDATRWRPCIPFALHSAEGSCSSDANCFRAANYHVTEARQLWWQIGLLAALPMVAAKAWSWTDDAHDRFPAMDQLQRERMDELQPLLTSMSLPQVMCL